MPDETDLPSTETAKTPRAPKGENVKDLVTPGDPAEAEAEAEEAEPPAPEKAPDVGGGEKASQADARRGDIEKLDEQRSEGQGEGRDQGRPAKSAEETKADKTASMVGLAG